MWWHTLLVPSLERQKLVESVHLRQLGLHNEFQDSQGYVGRCCLKIQKQTYRGLERGLRSEERLLPCRGRGLVSSTHISSSQLPLSPAPGNRNLRRHCTHMHVRTHSHTHKYISPFILFQIPMWFPLILFYSVFPILKYLYIFPFELSEMARILASRWNWFFPSDPGIAEIAGSRWRGPPSSCPSHQPRAFPMCRARKLQGFGFCCSWDHLVNACCSYLLGALPAPTQVSRGYFCGLRGHLATVIERKPYITTRPASLIL